MIGWYVHHQGRGHLHRAQALAPELAQHVGCEVAGLSSLPRPEGWPGPWWELPDDAVPAPVDPTARGQLHYVPRGGTGLRARMAALSAFLDRCSPRAVVVDISVEVTLLVRLHGVPVVSFVLPGTRDDAPHLTGMRTADALVAAWPPPPDGVDMTPQLPDDLRRRVVALGGVSRFQPAVRERRTPDRPHVVVLQGRGGGQLTAYAGAELEERMPAWRWTVLGGAGTWVGDLDELRAVLLDADVAVAHAGQGAVADLAALQLPAVVVPAPRPYDEQDATVAALAAGGWPVVAADAEHALDQENLERAVALDGARWDGWCGADPATALAHVVKGVG